MHFHRIYMDSGAVTQIPGTSEGADLPKVGSKPGSRCPEFGDDREPLLNKILVQSDGPHKYCVESRTVCEMCKKGDINNFDLRGSDRLVPEFDVDDSHKYHCYFVSSNVEAFGILQKYINLWRGDLLKFEQTTVHFLRWEIQHHQCMVGTRCRF